MVLIVRATSSGFHGGSFANITVNGLPVDISVNNHNHERGLHVVVINPESGEVESAKIYDTHMHSEGLDAFIKNGVPDGYIVAVACKDECANNISNNIRLWLSNMGSKHIWNVQYQ